eukprot:TRINITY_DN36036_c0_g1_i1.p1 TRINITY_DN36036_c0_g1~~TRINITY_DN36036_c0_g1_i1.p1  ORF type:complete len:368 (+),score=117.96 TRINITY_DN36036_c0_g1_i1:52-1104(+)
MADRERFEAFYRHYCPDALETLPVVLASYRGREEELWRRLVARHGSWPPSSKPAALAPAATPGTAALAAPVTRTSTRASVAAPAGAPEPTAAVLEPTAAAAPAEPMAARGFLSAATVFIAGMPPGDSYDPLSASVDVPPRPGARRARLGHEDRRRICKATGGRGFTAADAPVAALPPPPTGVHPQQPAAAPPPSEARPGALKFQQPPRQRPWRAPVVAVPEAVEEPPPQPAPTAGSVLVGPLAQRHEADHIRNYAVIEPWQLRRLQRYLEVRAPQHLRHAATILEQWRGYEETLFKLLRRQYGKEPSPRRQRTAASLQLPPGWRRLRDGRGDMFYEHGDGRAQWQCPVEL